MYFRSLSLLATFACAGFAIADSGLTNALSNSASLPKLDTSVLPKVPRSPVDTTAVTGALAHADVAKFPTLPIRRDVAHPTLPEALKTVAVKVTAIANKLKSAISNEAGTDSSLVHGLVNDFVDVLTSANDAVQYIIDHHEEFELTLDGVPVKLEVVSTYTTGFLYVQFTTLVQVVDSVNGGVHDSVISLVDTIGVQTTHLITRTLTLTPDLLEYITPGVKGLAQTIQTLNVSEILVALGIN